MMRLFATRRLFSLLFFIVIFVECFHAQTSEEEAQHMLELVNEVRAERGIAPLILNMQLSTAAYNHSYDMASNNYFSHTGLNGSSFSERVVAAGYNGSPRGENIAAGNYSVNATFNQWLNSPGHLNNMLNSNANEMGIGHASYTGSTYTHYWTQIFGQGEVLSNDNVITAKFKVYPNPVKDILFIRIPTSFNEPFDLKLFSATGQLILHQSQSLDSKLIKMDMSNLPIGIYFMSIKNVTQKIIKY